MSTPSDKEARDARLDRAVAEDVAVGMAAKADQEAVRAEIAEDVAVSEATRAEALAAQNVRQGAHLNQVRAERNAEALSGSVAREQARNASFGFWLLLGVIGVVLAVGAIWLANRPDQEPVATTVINQRPAATPPATAPTAPVQVQIPAPAPAAAPPVVVDRPVPVPVPVPAQPARQPDTTIIVEPAPGSAAPAAGTTGEGADTTTTDNAAGTGGGE